MAKKKIYTQIEIFEKLGRTLGNIFEHVEEKDRLSIIKTIRIFTKSYLDAERDWR